MSDVIRAGKIIGSALLIAGGAIALAISSAVKRTGDEAIQLGLLVLTGVGVWLFMRAWLGVTNSRATPARADDVDVQIQREVERMRAIARAAGAKPSEATGG